MQMHCTQSTSYYNINHNSFAKQQENKVNNTSISQTAHQNLLINQI